MSERLQVTYRCDVCEETAAVRHIFHPPDDGGIVAYVTELCEKHYAPVEAVQAAAMKNGGARPWDAKRTGGARRLNEDEIITPNDPPVRSTKAKVDSSGGRWMVTKKGNRQHWMLGSPPVSRCGFMNLDGMNPGRRPTGRAEKCGQCLRFLAMDHGAGVDAAPADEPPVPAPAPQPAAAPAPPPALFSAAPGSPPHVVKATVKAMALHVPGQFTSVAEALPYAEWPRHPAFTWVDFKASNGGRSGSDLTKAHGRRIADNTSLCSRIPPERLADQPESTGENRPCGLCLSTAFKIVRVDQKAQQGPQKAAERMHLDG